MASRADQMNQLSGTIAPAGSLSQVIDTEGWSIPGLLFTATTGTLTAGNIQFRVGVVPGTLYPLNDGLNARVAIAFTGVTGIAYSGVAIQVIAPFRYVQVETSVNQVNGAKVTLPVKLA